MYKFHDFVDQRSSMRCALCHKRFSDIFHTGIVFIEEEEIEDCQ